MSRPIQLSHIGPLAKGRMRLVFEHPHDRSLLIKVIRPDVIERRWGAGAAWYKRRRRYGRYISYLREIQEYLVGHASHGGSIPFAQRIVGFVETDLGLGLIVEAALDRSGNLATPLSAMILRRQFDSTVQDALEVFLVQLLNCDLVVADLNPGNLVYAYAEQLGNHFVLIDGLGSASAFPFKNFSRYLNRKSKESRIKRLRKSIEKRMLAAALAD